MKTITKYIVLILIVPFLSTSCEEYYVEGIDEEPYSEYNNLIEEYDLWYVDYHKTEGASTIPYLNRAFTISFVDGVVYANNNISGIGFQGNGLGIDVGTYSTNYDYLRANHDLDGVHSFDVIKTSQNEIEIYNGYTNTRYYLIGYQVDDFNYDKLFYENIEYLLQDYEVWSKISVSNTGGVNEFDNENFLKFTAENDASFLSSKSTVGTEFVNIFFDYEGGYEIYDVNGYDDLKVLTLDYDSGDVETFELSVLSDKLVELYHISSETTYKFEGEHFIQYLKSKKAKRTERNRKKIIRKKINKISY
jgi:hypothetical protein